MSYFGSLGWSLLRYISLAFDMVVYTLIRIFYNLFDQISQVTILQGGLVEDIRDRVYAIIGVYAIFKVVFVLINMMVNPDEAAKGNNSAGKVAVRIVVMLALIIIVPEIFNKAFELQNAVVRENVIGQLIIGEDVGGASGRTEYDKDGKITQTAMQKKYGDIGQHTANQIWSSFLTMNELATNPGTTEEDGEAHLNDDAKTSCAKPFIALTNLRSDVETQNEETKNQGISNFFGLMGETFESSTTGEKEFCLDYKMFLSTIAGGLAAYMFIIYCLDIGLRVVKLVFYQLIAPIPIASYIDGKKDGPFQKWTKSCLMEYADIFLRLVIIYTVILLIKEVDQIFDFSMLSGATGLFARVVVILGLLMFAKQAPQLILDMFGVKSSGRFSLNAKEKFEKAPLARAAIVGGAVGTAALAANIGKTAVDTTKAVRKVKAEGGSKGQQVKAAIAGGFKTAGSGVAGAFSGTARGLKAGAQKNAGFGKSIGDQLQATTNKRDLRGYRQQAGYTMGRRLVDQGLNFFGQDTIAKTEVKSREAQIQAMQQNVSMYNTRASELASKILSFNDPERQKLITEAVYDTATGNYKDASGNVISNITADELSYKKLLEARDAESKKIVDETKKKKTYDEAYNRMERKKQG